MFNSSRVTRSLRKKISQLLKVAKTFAELKMPKKPLRYSKTPCFENSYFRQECKNLLKQIESQNFVIFGLLSDLPKADELERNCTIWSL